MVNQYLNEHGNLDRFFTPKQLAAYLGSSVSALSQYRAQGTGLEPVTYGLTVITNCFYCIF